MYKAFIFGGKYLGNEWEVRLLNSTKKEKFFRSNKEKGEEMITREQIVYSKGLPQYFISDILEEDIACAYNDEETKYILFDDFSCWDEGVYVGQVSKDVIEQMPKANT